MKNVTVYSSDTCGYCTLAKDFLKAKGVEFVEKNISRDAEARQHLIANGFMGVPVIYVDDQVIQGFDKAKLESLL